MDELSRFRRSYRRIFWWRMRWAAAFAITFLAGALAGGIYLVGFAHYV